jgi:predicted RNA-binding protein associated with RNAse of E/G family
MQFDVGQTVVRRFLHADGRIAAAQATRVLSDDHRGLALWLDIGAARTRRTTLDGTPTRALPVRAELATATTLGPATWGPYRSLVLIPPGATHSVAWSWTADGTFIGWYVNLESPPVRWGGGIDVQDRALDIRVAPDRSWQWKDEDEFADRAGDPLFFDAATAGAIRAEGQRVADTAARGEFPFDGTWRDFRPDADWATAELPPWWDVPADTDRDLWRDTRERDLWRDTRR